MPGVLKKLAVAFTVATIVLSLSLNIGLVKSEAAKLTITVHPGIHADWLRLVIPDFEKKTGIKVEIVEIPYASLHEKQLADFIAGTGAYDLVETPIDGVPLYLPPGHYEEIDPKRAKEFDLDDFPEVMMKHAYYKGKLYLIPFNANGYVLCYRKDLFEDPKEKAAFKAKYGYELKPPETWDQLVDMAKFFTRDTNNDGKIDFWGYSHISEKGTRLSYVFLNRVHIFGGQTLDENMRVAFNNEIGVEAMQSFLDLLPYCPPGVTTYTWADCYESFAQGMVAMCEQWPLVVTMTQDPKRSKVVGKTSLSIIPPKKGVAPITDIGGWYYGVSKYSKNKGAAFELLKYVTSKEATIRAPLSGYQEPARKSVYMSPELLKVYPHFVKNWKILEGRGWQPPMIPEYTKLADILSAVVSETFLGKHTPKETVTLIAEKWEAELERAGYYRKR